MGLEANFPSNISKCLVFFRKKKTPQKQYAHSSQTETVIYTRRVFEFFWVATRSLFSSHHFRQISGQFQGCGILFRPTLNKPHVRHSSWLNECKPWNTFGTLGGSRPTRSSHRACSELRKQWTFTWQVCCHPAIKSLQSEIYWRFQLLSKVTRKAFYN